MVRTKTTIRRSYPSTTKPRTHSVAMKKQAVKNAFALYKETLYELAIEMDNYEDYSCQIDALKPYEIPNELIELTDDDVSSTHSADDDDKYSAETVDSQDYSPETDNYSASQNYSPETDNYSVDSDATDNYSVDSDIAYSPSQDYSAETDNYSAETDNYSAETVDSDIAYSPSQDNSAETAKYSAVDSDITNCSADDVDIFSQVKNFLQMQTVLQMWPTAKPSQDDK